MADISKITLLDGQEYDIKDAVARAAIPAAATAAPKMDGAAAVGSSPKYAKEDHVHPIDSNTFTLIPAGIEVALNSDLNDIDTPGNYYNTTGDTSTINNTPSQAGSNPGAFKLVVLKSSRLNTANGLIYQFFFSGNTSGGTIYMRSRSTRQVWTEWACLTEPNKVNGHTVESDVPTNAVFTDTISSGYCTTASDVATKQINLTNMVARDGSLFEVLFTNENTYTGKVYLKIANNMSQELYLNGIITSSTNYSFPAGKYLVYDSGTAYYIRTDSVFPIKDSSIIICESNGDSQDKTLIFSENYNNFFKPLPNYDFFIFVRFIKANSYSGLLKLKLQYKYSSSTVDLYINGEISSATNCTIPAGIYPLRISNTKHCDLRTDHRLPVSIIGDATTVNGHTIESDVPAGVDWPNICDMYKTNLSFIYGSIASATGANASDTNHTRARTDDYLSIADPGYGFDIDIPSTFRLYVYFYDESKTLAGKVSWVTGYQRFSSADIPANSKYIRFVASKIGNTSFELDDIPSMYFRKLLYKDTNVYSVGDTYTPSGAFMVSGYCASQSMGMIGFSFVLPKRIGRNVSAVTLNGLKIRLCRSSGYLTGYSANNGTDVSGDAYKPTPSIRADNIVHVTLTHDDFKSLNNGEALSIYANNVSLTFS